MCGYVQQTSCVAVNFIVAAFPVAVVLVIKSALRTQFRFVDFDYIVAPASTPVIVIKINILVESLYKLVLADQFAAFFTINYN